MAPLRYMHYLDLSDSFTTVRIRPEFKRRLILEIDLSRLGERRIDQDLLTLDKCSRLSYQHGLLPPLSSPASRFKMPMSIATEAHMQEILDLVAALDSVKCKSVRMSSYGMTRHELDRFNQFDIGLSYDCVDHIVLVKRTATRVQAETFVMLNPFARKTLTTTEELDDQQLDFELSKIIFSSLEESGTRQSAPLVPSPAPSPPFCACPPRLGTRARC